MEERRDLFEQRETVAAEFPVFRHDQHLLEKGIYGFAKLRQRDECGPIVSLGE